MLGLGLRNGYYPSGWTVPTGAAARWVFDAPAGTGVVGIRANAYFEQRHFRWQVGLSNGSQLFVGCPASSSSTGGSCGAHMTASDYLPLPWSGAVYTEVFCANGPCPVGGGSYYGWASMTWVAVTVLDPTSPSVSSPSGELWSDRWMGGTRQVTFDAADNTGIRDVRVLLDGREMSRDGRVCDPAAKTCPNWPGAALDVATSRRRRRPSHAGARGGGQGRERRVDLAPGTHRQHRACGSFRSRGRRRRRLEGDQLVHRVLDEPEAGRRADRRARSTSSAPRRPGPAHAYPGRGPGPICRASRGSRYRRPGSGFSSVWLGDAAGNARRENAAAPVYLRLDTTPPEMAFRPLNVEDPSRLTVEASDTPSGVARGEIEVRRRGKSTWRALQTELSAGGLTAVLPDERMRDGVYDLRARAWDGAGNERSTDRLSFGRAGSGQAAACGSRRACASDGACRSARAVGGDTASSTGSAPFSIRAGARGSAVA